MAARVATSLLALGGNRHPSAAAWSPHGTLAFGAGRCVALWNPQDETQSAVYATLKAHTDKVNAVEFLPRRNAHDEIILSGSVDKTLRIWRRSGAFFDLATTVEGVHKGSINDIATCPEHPELFASTASDGTIAIFKLSITADNITVEHLQTITTMPKYIALTLALSGLPNSESAVILVAGGSTNTIFLYTASAPSAEFACQASLTGHENWVRSLSITHEDPRTPTSDLLISSASQDRYIRLWRVHTGEDLPAPTEKSESKTFGFTNQLTNKAHILRFPSCPSSVWSVTFEALLMGHEDWIFTSLWNPTPKESADLRLLSCSADNSISVWAEEAQSGTWNPISRFGELSNLKGGSTATGSAGGIWNAIWSPDGNSVAALTKSGAWRVWRYDSTTDRWEPKIGISGHTKDVTSISWARDGGYLLSTSLDQTTRLWAQWTSAAGTGQWHEFSRPQIHGYDINCIASVGTDRFVSGAEEKLLRVFDEPKAVAEMLKNLCGLQRDLNQENLLDAAGLPVLGLSNKPLDASVAVVEDPEEVEKESVSGAAEPTEDTASAVEKPAASTQQNAPSSTPPLEDTLSRLTLWPETEKLYGHGYELSALCASPVSGLIATACKASTVEHAVIRLYDGDKGWEEVEPPLKSHALTVTSLKFSDDGKWLASVGRDRAWSLFTHGEGENGKEWRLVEKKEKAHTRIIFDCAWIPGSGSDERAFITASREKSIKLWTFTPNVDNAGINSTCVAAVKFPAPVTALDVLGTYIDGNAWIAAGLDDGSVYMYAVKKGKWETVEKRLQLDARSSPDKGITEVAWRPVLKDGEKNVDESASRRELAVASEDSSVRIFDIPLV
ncbi:WD40 repeat-like protein [Ascodesmis nigricans]|uniref:Elongator complex protein 2 n=1 Tax=Ascodesmis nigricans TaxID=341454 RepID=A0A4S2N202_9PEZI|nr:WD40 repeat-like protein [Ascodesmis nigricans]